MPCFMKEVSVLIGSPAALPEDLYPWYELLFSSVFNEVNELPLFFPAKQPEKVGTVKISIVHHPNRQMFQAKGVLNITDPDVKKLVDDNKLNGIKVVRNSELMDTEPTCFCVELTVEERTE